jgi:hypothetical protein
MLWQANLQTFIEMVLIFILLGDEVKNYRKTSFETHAVGKKYGLLSPKMTVFRAKMAKMSNQKQL